MLLYSDIIQYYLAFLQSEYRTTFAKQCLVIFLIFCALAHLSATSKTNYSCKQVQAAYIQDPSRQAHYSLCWEQQDRRSALN